MKIPRRIYQDIVDHALQEAPLEACGYLAGEEGIVRQYYRMTNIDQSPVHYRFAPEEQVEVFKRVQAEKTELIGVYHSHPASEARPSPEDIRLAYDPFISYVIISLQQKPYSVQAFKINNRHVRPEPLEIL